jgi:hypothetical protein
MRLGMSIPDLFCHAIYGMREDAFCSQTTEFLLVELSSHQAGRHLNRDFILPCYVLLCASRIWQRHRSGDGALDAVLDGVPAMSTMGPITCPHPPLILVRPSALGAFVARDVVVTFPGDLDTAYLVPVPEAGVCVGRPILWAATV